MSNEAKEVDFVIITAAQVEFDVAHTRLLGSHASKVSIEESTYHVGRCGNHTVALILGDPSRGKNQGRAVVSGRGHLSSAMGRIAVDLKREIKSHQIYAYKTTT